MSGSAGSGSPTHRVRGACDECEPMPAVPCPLAGCSEEHELRRAKNKRASAFINCPTWGSSIIWFRSPAASEFLNANNGGASLPIRENPAESDDEPLPREPRNPNFRPTITPDPTRVTHLTGVLERLRAARLLREERERLEAQGIDSGN